MHIHMYLGVVVGSILQFMATMEILHTTLCGEKCLLIVEGMNPLLLAQKVSICTFIYVYICRCRCVCVRICVHRYTSLIVYVYIYTNAY
jgi:hypothetical protein